MDAVDAAQVAADEGWQGVARGVVVCLSAVAIAWHTPSVSLQALGVLALAAVPSALRASLAPRLARLLKG